MELLQIKKMQLNGASTNRRNASEWSSCKEKEDNWMVEWKNNS